MRHLTTSFSAALAAGRLLLPLLLVAGLAGCGGPSASTDVPTVPPTASPAHDSVRATLTTPAPDATGTRADTATQPTPPAPQPLPRPGAALPRPAPRSVAATPAGPGPQPPLAAFRPAGCWTRPATHWRAPR